eukprot:scaffold153202_cov33-Tisochrysis_lutea.AAC.2
MACASLTENGAQEGQHQMGWLRVGAGCTYSFTEGVFSALRLAPPLALNIRSSQPLLWPKNVDSGALTTSEGGKLIERDAFLVNSLQRLTARGSEGMLIKPTPASLPRGIWIDPKGVQHHS